MDKIKAVIFDMDGLMFDTERIWVESVMRANEKFGTNVTQEFLVSCMGKTDNLIDEEFKKVLPAGIDVRTFRDYNRKILYEIIDQTGPRPKKGLFELLNFLKAHHIKTAVATSSYSPKIDKYFGKAGLDKAYFDVILCGDQLSKSKPDPEIYLKACELLKVQPKNAIALEDSANGLLSAYRAGTKPVFIKDLKEHDSEILSKVYRRFDDLAEVISLFKK